MTAKTKNKRVLKLANTIREQGRTVRELRDVLRQIETGDVTGVCFVAVKRHGGCYTYADNNCYLRALGGVHLLADHIARKNFRED